MKLANNFLQTFLPNLRTPFVKPTATPPISPCTLKDVSSHSFSGSKSSFLLAWVHHLFVGAQFQQLSN